MESTSLELLHSFQLDMLVKFDRICEENHLTYFLDSGTALGAVRHQGFIPWDDDVDVGMPREDYDRLLEIGSEGVLRDNLFLQTNKTDAAYAMPFAKIRLGDTFFPEGAVDVRKMKYQGLYIDIFPFDKVPQDKQKAIHHIKKSRFWYFVSVFSRRDYPGKKIPQKVLSYLLHHTSDNTVAKLHEYYGRHCKKYNAEDTKTRTCFCWRISQRQIYLFEESELFPTIKMPFEGRELCMMHNPHAYLTKMFGDYNQLPPEEERKSHLAGCFRI
jgi:lipopolysaccharide cholinephosphotransferase